MTDGVEGFGHTAERLARNPLGLIALFIVLVYGFAALVTGFTGSLTQAERLPLVYFMVIFPVLVLGVFGWLVSRHSTKLYAPSDFKDESNYVQLASASVSLALAEAKVPSMKDIDIDSVVADVQSFASSGVDLRTWRSHVLWVDDHPEGNANEQAAFEATGLRFTIVTSTDEALAALRSQRFAAVISDMAREEGEQEGYVLLDQLRATANKTPYFLYTGHMPPGGLEEAVRRGAQGCTTSPRELFRMVSRAISER